MSLKIITSLIVIIISIPIILYSKRETVGANNPCIKTSHTNAVVVQPQLIKCANLADKIIR